MVRLLVPLLALAIGWWFYLRLAGETRDRLARARADFLAPAEDTAGEDVDLKEIAYRGGLVRFRIPATWREEYEPEGGAAFFDPASRQRTLRLRTLTIEKPGSAGRDALAFLLGSLRRREESALLSLPDGQLLLKHVDAGREAGVDVVLYTWQLARSVSDDRARIAVFTLAVPAAHAIDVLTRDDRRRVERIVRTAAIAI